MEYTTLKMIHCLSEILMFIRILCGSIRLIQKLYTYNYRMDLYKNVICCFSEMSLSIHF